MDEFFRLMGWASKDGRALKHAKWDDPKIRRAAVVFFVKEVLRRKDPRMVGSKDFRMNHLGGLLDRCGSAYAAITEAFPEEDIHPWEMSATPSGFFNDRKNRIAATKWLAAKVNVPVESLVCEDFDTYGLGGLLRGRYSNSSKRAMREADPSLRDRIVVGPFHRIK
jgi:hypothetical protein